MKVRNVDKCTQLLLSKEEFSALVESLPPTLRFCDGKMDKENLALNTIFGVSHPIIAILDTLEEEVEK